MPASCIQSKRHQIPGGSKHGKKNGGGNTNGNRHGFCRQSGIRFPASSFTGFSGQFPGGFHPASIAEKPVFDNGALTALPDPR